MSRGPLDGSVSSFASLAAIAPLGFTNQTKNSMASPKDDL